MRICVTGHRPNKLWGYDISNREWTALKDEFKRLLIARKCVEAITGMALGVDTVFALAVLELKDAGHDIKLHCALPCQNQERFWSPEAKKQYHEILEKADEVTTVTDAPYSAYLMQKRNQFMVDNSDTVLAVWDGSKSGTGNGVEYAKKKNVPVFVLEPSQVLEFENMSYWEERY